MADVMELEELRFEIDGPIATITLNAPERMNALGKPMIASWESALRRSAEDDAIRVVILTGEGRGFCAGANLKERAEENARGMTAIDRRHGLRLGIHRVPQALQYLDKPYIAAVNGPATGAGMDMASMADIRFASDRARFGMAYRNVGLIPGDGGAWLLPRIVGTTRALELIWSGDLFDAQQALEMGYVSRVIPHDDLLTETRAYAERLADGPPIAMQTAKRLVYRGLNQTFMEALDAAQNAMTVVQSTDDAKEGPRAFAEKRKPEFKGR
jgi:2-(1,2-epoxy-1,2-dihydrophenyl)acetyl-CoA isomerase